MCAGAWWDLVDQVSHCVGAVLLADHAAALPVIRGWLDHPDRWLRRASIICQLGLRDRTDLRLLADAIATNLAPAPGAEDFFIRKAIGWALREYGKTDPAYVVAFVAAEPRLSPLSRREALRRIEQEPAGVRRATPDGRGHGGSGVGDSVRTDRERAAAMDPYAHRAPDDQ